MAGGNPPHASPHEPVVLKRCGVPRRYPPPRRSPLTIAPPALALDPPYLRRICAVPTPYLGRFMFGFRLKAKPEHEAAQVGRWYGAYTAQIGRRC